MSKTTPEEAIQLVRKHQIDGIWTAPRILGLAALIDEVRGVDAEPAEQTEYCWLVELFEGINGNSAGLYHTGFVDIGGYSRTTRNPHEARKYTKGQAESVAIALGTTLTGTWRAVEHGFDARPAPSQPAAPVELPVVGEIERGHYGGRARNIGFLRVALYDKAPVMAGDKLVKLSDAQAAIAAGRKA